MIPIPRCIAMVLAEERQRLRSLGSHDDTPKLPCCTLWARVLRLHFGLTDDPAFDEVPGDPEGSSNHARINSWPEAIAYTGDRWCAVGAVEEMGGRELLTTRPDQTQASLRPGKWHVGQCWSPVVGGQWRGDMYGVLMAEDGSQMVYVSDITNGFRALPWWEEEWLQHLRRNIFGAGTIERRVLVV